MHSILTIGIITNLVIRPVANMLCMLMRKTLETNELHIDLLKEDRQEFHVGCKGVIASHYKSKCQNESIYRVRSEIILMLFSWYSKKLLQR